MPIYERNYRRLLELVPDLARRAEPRVVLEAGPSRLIVEIVERHRFTTVVRITQRLPLAGPASSATMSVRLYHDARLAEVIAYQHQRRFQPRYDYPNVEMLQVREKRRVNEFLGEWLDSCIVQSRLGAFAPLPT